jgi:hypothetical protein
MDGYRQPDSGYPGAKSQINYRKEAAETASFLFFILKLLYDLFGIRKIVLSHDSRQGNVPAFQAEPTFGTAVNMILKYL